MKVVRIGKYTLMRHWLRWYWVQQDFGGDTTGLEYNRLTRIDFKTNDVEEIE